jgi:histone H2A
MVASQ